MPTREKTIYDCEIGMANIRAKKTNFDCEIAVKVVTVFVSINELNNNKISINALSLISRNIKSSYLCI